MFLIEGNFYMLPIDYIPKRPNEVEDFIPDVFLLATALFCLLGFLCHALWVLALILFLGLAAVKILLPPLK